MEWIFNKFKNSNCNEVQEQDLKSFLSQMLYTPYNLLTRKKLELSKKWRYDLLDVVWIHKSIEDIAGYLLNK